jgi:hypothetical protein
MGNVEGYKTQLTDGANQETAVDSQNLQAKLLTSLIVKEKAASKLLASV